MMIPASRACPTAGSTFPSRSSPSVKMIRTLYFLSLALKAEMAIETAISAFNAKERKYKVLIIFTDGEDLEGKVDPAVGQAREAGIIIYTVGVGTAEGKPIPVRDEKGDVVEYRKDENGQIVVSRLDETTLSRIAAETGGRYYRATTSESELDAMYEEISGMEKKELESRLFQSFEDQFQYPLAAAVLCLAAECWISDRRKRHDA